MLFLSYPKSGRTWVRFLVDAYLADLHGIQVPNVFDAERRLDPRWRIEWEHLTGAMIQMLPYDRVGEIDLPSLDGRTCVWLSRDPYATLASAYFQARDRVKVFQGTPSEFVRSPLFGARKLAAFQALVESLKDRFSSFTPLTYEGFQADPAAGLRTVLEALGAEVDPERIGNAVALGTFENLRRLARAPEYAGSPIAPVDPGNPGSEKIRRGGDGGWREIFSEEDTAYIESVISHSASLHLR
ncbi:MAG TPA: sulfotransferase domain-containing protein [Thermoanaerobaculia bacterium]|nr:sulfotransferase domain-containing protein [Thermoanaerobaculia bacterium]